MLFAARHEEGDRNSLNDVVLETLHAHSFKASCSGRFILATGSCGNTNEDPEIAIYCGKNKCVSVVKR